MNYVAFRRQSGGTLLGFIVGLLVGLGIAVAVALYVTNAPVPFVTKVRPASEAVNPATAGGPNKSLYAPAPVLKGGSRIGRHGGGQGKPGHRPEGRPTAGRKGRRRRPGRRWLALPAAGRDQAGNEVSANGTLSVNFGDFGDPQ